MDKVKWPASLLMVSTALGSVAIAPAEAQILTTLPYASTPLGSQDACYVVQSGVSKQYFCTAPNGVPIGTVTSISLNVACGLTATPNPVITTGTVSLAPIVSGDMLANIGGGTACPVAVTGSAFLDAVFGSAQGDVLYRGASVWAALAPGVANQALVTQGASANPAYAYETRTIIASWDSNTSINNSTLDLMGDWPYAANSTIPAVYTIAHGSGTFTASVLDNGNTLTSCGAINVVSTKGTATCTGANTPAQHDSITLVITNATSASSGGYVELLVTTPLK